MQTADKATLEIFKANDEGTATADLAQEIVRRAVIPAAEVGGDSRLQMPPPNRIQTEQLEHAKQVLPFLFAAAADNLSPCWLGPRGKANVCSCCF